MNQQGEFDPYRAPAHSGRDLELNPRRGRLDLLTLVLWPVVFAGNMVVPLLFGWEITRDSDSGRVGMGAAAAVLLAAGWALAVWRPVWARLLLIGGTVVGCTQIFPVLQLLVGMFVIGVASELGVIGGALGPGLTTEWEGFVVTLAVGSILLSCAAVVAWLAGWFFPNIAGDVRAEQDAASS